MPEQNLPNGKVLLALYKGVSDYMVVDNYILLWVTFPVAISATRVSAKSEGTEGSPVYRYHGTQGRTNVYFN